VYTPDLELFLTVLKCDLLVPCVISHGNITMCKISAKIGLKYAKTLEA
jgi:hypothetical protein